MSPADRAVMVRQLAAAAGFPLCRVARAEPIGRAGYVREWLRSGRAGTMDYLGRTAEVRLDPRRLLDGARSVIVAAFPYAQPMPAVPEDGRPAARTAMYAWGEDYHVVVKKRLFAISDRLCESFENTQAVCCVDAKPVLEREWAAAAGIGWIGKNTLVLHPRLGSYFFLGVIVTTLELAPDEPIADHCGTCTKCLDACPTQAFPAPHEMDASRCISYLTIEHHGQIPAELQERMRGWVFGCDVCQEVCPFNQDVPTTHEPRFAPRPGVALPDLREWLAWTPEAYRRTVKKTPMRRASMAMLQRNARIAMRRPDDANTPPP